jgi:hypothetical protein
MPANQFGIDVGEAITAGQNLLKNKLLIDKAQEEIDTGNALKKARQRLASGDQSALQDMLVLSPEETNRYVTTIGQMDENKRKQFESNLNQIGAVAAAILHSDNPEQAYQWIKTQVSPEIGSQMPDKYNSDWVAYQLAQAKDGMALLQKMSNAETQGPPTKVKFGNEDILYDKKGREIGRTNSKSIDSSDGGKSSVSSQDLKTAEDLADQIVGGTMTIDPETGLKYINKGAAAQKSWVLTRAMFLRKNSGNTQPLSAFIDQAKRDMDAQLQREGKAGNGKRTPITIESVKAKYGLK